MALFCASGGTIHMAKAGAVNDAVTRSDVVTYVNAEATGSPADIFTDGWDELPHTVSLELSANVEEPTKIRTSDTNGVRVAPNCGSTVEYELSVTSALDPTDWLWCYILSTPTDPGTGRTSWIRVRPLGPTDPTGQVFLKVKVNPGGYGFDNDQTEAVTTEWTASVLESPVFPACGTNFNVQDNT